MTARTRARNFMIGGLIGVDSQSSCTKKANAAPMMDALFFVVARPAYYGGVRD